MSPSFVYLAIVCFWCPVNGQLSTIYNYLSPPEDGPIVETTSGNVRGQILEYEGHQIHQWLGIPYAEPPIGDLRFQKTSPIKNPGENTIQATYFKSPCVQLTPLIVTLLEIDDTTSENCLYMNIWSPAKDLNQDKKAVLFFVHGGVYLIGSANQNVYNGLGLAAMGDIVVVTFNYRLGKLGFLYTGDSGDNAPGNMGLWDQFEALKWVNTNIDKFGGDPSKVTIAGEQSGGMSVSLLASSPLTQDYFSRVISMSGASLSPWYIEPKTNALTKAVKLAKRIGCPIEKLSHLFPCYKNVNGDTLVVVSSIFADSLNGDRRKTNQHLSIPIFGDELLPEKLPKLIQKYPKGKQLLMGNVGFEGGIVRESIFSGIEEHLKIHLDPDLVENDWQKWKAKFNEYVEEQIPEIQSEDLEMIRKIYINETMSFQEREDAMTEFYGEVNFLCPVIAQAQQAAKHGNDVWLYLFDHTPRAAKIMDENEKTWQAMDLMFLFAYPGMNPEKPFDEQDQKVVKNTINIFTKFIRDGKLKFPNYKKSDTFRVLVSTQGAKIIKGYKEMRCEILDSYLTDPQYLKSKNELEELIQEETLWEYMYNQFLFPIVHETITTFADFERTIQPLVNLVREMASDAVFRSKLYDIYLAFFLD